MIRLLGLLPALLAGVTDADPLRLPRIDPVPGGITVVELMDADGPAPRAYLGNERVMVIGRGGQWRAIVGVPLSWNGELPLVVLAATGEMKYDLAVRAKEYGVQHIRLKNQRLVEPNAEDLQRIEREQREIQAAFAHWRDIDAPDMRFDLPARGRLSGNFGLRRFFNDAPRQPHSGIDIAAPSGTPVVAPADGIVLQTGDYFFNGRTLFLDHGQGLVSMYNHLHRIDVDVGMPVTRGQQIGEVGASGRATGPHLHWAVGLNGARVDPLLFVPQALTSRTPTKTENKKIPVR